jgi:dihydrofolate reductase
MRKLTASLFISLDGVVEAPETWHFPYFNEEMGAVIGQGIAGCDAFLLGRRTYEEWAEFWPSQDPAQNPMAAAINSKHKFVVSRSLDTASWENSSVIGGDLAGAVSKLKEEPGNEISVTGSATLVRSLLQAGLLDELRLLLHPIVVGKGARLFDGTGDQIPLELVESQTLSTGVLNLTYRPA